MRRGPAMVKGSRYEVARGFVLGQSLFRNTLLVLTSARPEHIVSAEYFTAEQGSPVGMSIYGIRFLFNLEEAPALDPRVC